MDSKKKKYFFVEKPHLKHFLFLFFFIISIAKNAIQDTFSKTNNLSSPFLKVYIYIIADFLNFIPFIIVKIRTKRIRPDSNIHSNNDVELIYVNQESFTNKKKILNIITFASVDYIAQISMVIYYLIKQEYKFDVKEVNLNSLLIFTILFIILLSKLMLHTQFYRHHYFSSFIIILCLCVLVILDIIQMNKEQEGNKLLANIYLILRIFRVFLYSLEDVIGKLILLYQYFTTYSLLLNKSIIQIILSIIFSFPFIFVKIKDEENNQRSIYEMIGEIFDDKLNILKYFFFTIISFFYNILCWQIIDVFSPNHFCVAQVFEGFGLLIMNLIGNSLSYDSYLRIFMYILLILISCIYNEFLVINICGLAKDTKLFLDFKEEDDKLLSRKTVDRAYSEEINDINYSKTDASIMELSTIN